MSSASATDSRYLALWRRLDRVVTAHTDAGEPTVADFLMADFFMTFDNPNELERHIEAAEESLREGSAG